MILSQIGDIGESAVQTEALKRGYVVSKPFGVSEGYDLIIDTGKRLWKVQVKTSSAKGFRVAKEYGKNNGSKLNEYANGFDILVCYDLDLNNFYVIPSELVDRTKIKIGKESRYDIFKNNWAPFEYSTVNKSLDNDKLLDTGDDSTPF